MSAKPAAVIPMQRRVPPNPRATGTRNVSTHQKTMKVTASDFASLKDLAAFKAAKARGLSDVKAFAVGDNGIGC